MEASETSAPTIWRTKLRSTLHGEHTAQVDHCLDGGIVGIGWGHADLPTGASVEQVTQFIKAHDDPDWTDSGIYAVRRFANEADIGDFVWTRHTDSKYLLCQIMGPHSYVFDEASAAVDVHQIRPVEWAPRPLSELQVPGGVVRSFIGQSSSFNRIHDPATKELTPYLWEKLHDRPAKRPDLTPLRVLTEVLDPYDVEDLIYMWLQVERGYAALPRTQIKSTPAYEWTMIHRNKGNQAIVQVKTGGDRVELKELSAARADDETETYAYASTGVAPEDDVSLVSKVIRPEELLEFAANRPELLPERVRTLFELAQ